MKTLALSRKSKLAAFAVVLIIGGASAALVGGARSPRPHATSAAGGESASSVVAPSPNARFDRSRAPGLRHIYRTTFAQDLAMSGGDGRSSNARVRLKVTGELTLAFVAHVDENHRFYAELAKATVEIGARTSTTAAVEAELEKPFYVVASPDGRVRGYSFARGLSSTSRNILRGLVGAGQIAIRDGNAWTAEEDDVQGSYVASYTRQADGEIVKTKGAYEKVASMSALAPADESAAVETRGRGAAVIGDDGWMTSLSTDEHQKASMGEKMPVVTTDSRLEMRLDGTLLDASLLGRFEREESELESALPFGTGDDAEATRTADLRAVGSLTMDEMLATSRLGGDDAALAALAERMSARLRLTPDDANRAAELTKTLPAREGQLLVGALGGAGTREAGAALGKIVNLKEAPAAVRAQAATQLGISAEHAVEAKEPLMKGLSDSSREVRESSALALGSVARELGDGDIDSVEELVTRYEQASSDEERELYLRALGNTGSIAVLPIARAALAGPSESLHEVAAQSLRFLPVGEADATLGQIVLEGEGDRVRIAAVDAIGYRLVEMHAAVFERAIAAQPGGAVHGAIVEVVSRALASRGKTLSPQTRDVLAALARRA